MRGLSVYLSSTALGVGVFLAAQSLPPSPAAALQQEAARPADALDSRVATRLGNGAEIARVLAEGRAPVPWLRAFNAAWVPEEKPEPTVASLVARAPMFPPRVEVDPRSQTAAREARWQAVARRGSTEMAVTATP